MKLRFLFTILLALLLPAAVMAAPVASFTVTPAAPTVGQAVTFNGSASTADAGHTIVSYTWTFGDKWTGSGSTATHTYATASTFTVTLKVTDDAGLTGLKTQSVTVAASSGGGGGTPPPPTLPPPVKVGPFGDLTAYFRGNEGTEGMALVNMAKQMPGARINGLDQVYSLAYPTVSGVLRGMNCEHIIAGHDTPNDFFTCRLPHMVVTPVAGDDHSVEMEEYDTAWSMWIHTKFTLVEPHLIVMRVRVRFDDATKFAPQGHATVFFANYMPSTADWKQYFVGVPGPGQPAQWLGATLDTVEMNGGAFINVNASPLEVDPAPAMQWTGSVTYKQNLQSADYPRSVEPYYCTETTPTGMIMQMSFDRTWSLVDQIRFVQFKVKGSNTTNSPAQDWQYTVNHVVSGQEYGFTAGFSLRPRIATGSLENDCANAHAAFLAAIQ